MPDMKAEKERREARYKQTQKNKEQKAKSWKKPERTMHEQNQVDRKIADARRKSKQMF